jgi:osmotically-inducible protein OsmY
MRMDNASHLGRAEHSAQPASRAAAAQQLAADKRLAEAIEREIQERTGGKIHGLRVEVGAAGVRLQGRCSTFYCKQLAQHAAMNLAEKNLKGDGPLTNEIEVS